MKEFFSRTEVRIEKSSGQASGASGKIEILKLNSENINEKLKGAEFNLYSVNLNSGVHSLEAAKISDEDGLIVFDRNASGSSLMLDTLYCYQETKAPVGYVLDDTKYYFMLKGDNYSSAFPRAVELLGGNIIPSAGNSFSMFNTPEKKTLLADKIWKDYQGNVLSGEILAEFPEITLNVIKSYTDADNQVHSEQFEIKLNNGNNWHYEQVYNAKSSTGEEYTYSVSELAVDGYLSDVSINESEDRIEICAVNTEDFVPVELPETGGSGEMNFISIGLSLIAIGLLSGFMLKKSNLNSAKIKNIFIKKGKKR